jgi:hypothetical protein
MTSEWDDKVEASVGRLLVALAEINDRMMVIRTDLASNPAIVEATRGSDVRRYRDSFTQQEKYLFEAYVEAKTRTGHVFWWLVDITRLSEGWIFQRRIGKQAKDGEQIEREFEDRTFESFDELARNGMTLMDDFAESAKDFNFG